MTKLPIVRVSSSIGIFYDFQMTHPFDYSKSLQQLECEVWDERDATTRLVQRVLLLRKLPIEDFSLGDLRCLILQQISLEILLPRAFPILEINPLIESEYYPGDLLMSVLALGLGHPQLARHKERTLQIALNAFSNLKAERLLEFERLFRGLAPEEFGLTPEAYEKSKRAAMTEIEKSMIGKELISFIERLA